MLQNIHSLDRIDAVVAVLNKNLTRGGPVTRDDIAITGLTSTTNDDVVVTIRGIGKHTGSIDLRFKRVTFYELLGTSVIELDIAPLNVRALVESIYLKYNINLSEEDILNKEVNSNEDILVVFSPNSILYKGSFTVKISSSLKDISSLQSSYISYSPDVDDVLLAPKGKLNATYMLAQIEVKQKLHHLNVGDVIGSEERTHLCFSGVGDDVVWCTQEDPSEYNLKGSTVVNIKARSMNISGIQREYTLRLNSEYNTKYVGELVIFEKK